MSEKICAASVQRPAAGGDRVASAGMGASQSTNPRPTAPADWTDAREAPLRECVSEALKAVGERDLDEPHAAARLNALLNALLAVDTSRMGWEADVALVLEPYRLSHISCATRILRPASASVPVVGGAATGGGGGAVDVVVALVMLTVCGVAAGMG